MSPSSRYLNDPVGQFGLAGVFLCWCAYGILTGLTSYPGASYALMLMVGAAGMVLASRPRWIVYALLMGKVLGLPRAALLDLGTAAIFADGDHVVDEVRTFEACPEREPSSALGHRFDRCGVDL